MPKVRNSPLSKTSARAAGTFHRQTVVILALAVVVSAGALFTASYSGRFTAAVPVNCTLTNNGTEIALDPAVTPIIFDASPTYRLTGNLTQCALEVWNPDAPIPRFVTIALESPPLTTVYNNFSINFRRVGANYLLTIIPQAASVPGSFLRVRMKQNSTVAGEYYFRYVPAGYTPPPTTARCRFTMNANSALPLEPSATQGPPMDFGPPNLLLGIRDAGGGTGGCRVSAFISGYVPLVEGASQTAGQFTVWNGSESGERRVRITPNAALTNTAKIWIKLEEMNDPASFTEYQFRFVPGCYLKFLDGSIVRSGTTRTFDGEMPLEVIEQGVSRSSCVVKVRPGVSGDSFQTIPRPTGGIFASCYTRTQMSNFSVRYALFPCTGPRFGLGNPLWLTLEPDQGAPTTLIDVQVSSDPNTPPETYNFRYQSGGPGDNPTPGPCTLERDGVAVVPNSTVVYAPTDNEALILRVKNSQATGECIVQYFLNPSTPQSLSLNQCGNMGSDVNMQICFDRINPSTSDRNLRFLPFPSDFFREAYPGAEMKIHMHPYGPSNTYTIRFMRPEPAPLAWPPPQMPRDGPPQSIDNVFGRFIVPVPPQLPNQVRAPFLGYSRSAAGPFTNFAVGVPPAQPPVVDGMKMQRVDQGANTYRFTLSIEPDAELGDRYIRFNNGAIRRFTIPAPCEVISGLDDSEVNEIQANEVIHTVQLTSTCTAANIRFNGLALPAGDAFVDGFSVRFEPGFLRIRAEFGSETQERSLEVFDEPSFASTAYTIRSVPVGPPCRLTRGTFVNDPLPLDPEHDFYGTFTLNAEGVGCRFGVFRGVPGQDPVDIPAAPAAAAVVQRFPPPGQNFDVVMNNAQTSITITPKPGVQVNDLVHIFFRQGAAIYAAGDFYKFKYKGAEQPPPPAGCDLTIPGAAEQPANAGGDMLFSGTTNLLVGEGCTGVFIQGAAVTDTPNELKNTTTPVALSGLDFSVPAGAGAYQAGGIIPKQVRIVPGAAAVDNTRFSITVTRTAGGPFVYSFKFSRAAPPLVAPCTLQQGIRLIQRNTDEALPDAGITLTKYGTCPTVFIKDMEGDEVALAPGGDETTNSGMNAVRSADGNTITIRYLGMTNGEQLNLIFELPIPPGGGPPERHIYGFTWRGGVAVNPCTVESGLRQDRENLIPRAENNPLIGRVLLVGNCNGQISFPLDDAILGDAADATMNNVNFIVTRVDANTIRISAPAAAVGNVGVLRIGAEEYRLAVAAANVPTVRGYCCSRMGNACDARAAMGNCPVTWFVAGANAVQQEIQLACNTRCNALPQPPPGEPRSYICDATRPSNADDRVRNPKAQGFCSREPAGGRPGNQVHNGTFTRPTVGVFDTGLFTKQGCDDFCGYYYINYYSDLKFTQSFTPARGRPTQWWLNSPYAFGCGNQKVNIYGPPAQKTLCEEGGDEDVLTGFNAGINRYTGLLPPRCDAMTAAQKTEMTRIRNTLGPAITPCRNVLESMNGDQRKWVASQLWGTQVPPANLRTQVGRGADGAYNSFAACWNALPDWTQWHTVPCAGNNSFYHPLRNP